MFSRVLLPLDGSETADLILPQLRRLLIGHSPEILVFRSLDSAAPNLAVLGPALEAEAERHVRRITFQLVHEGRRARSLVRPGGAASAILLAALEEDVSLIALSTHGRSGLSRLVLGSVAETVLRSASVPVFLVRSFPPPLDIPSRGRTESTPIHSILVPLDGSELSRRVVPVVRELARPLDARVTLLHVNEPPGPHPRWQFPDLPLEEVERDLRAATIPVTTAIREGTPAEQILVACRHDAADLLVMASHGRSGPVRWLFGSVTECVLRAAEIPMLVVPARQAPEPDPRLRPAIDRPA